MSAVLSERLTSARRIHAVELAVWGSCALLGVAVVLGTLGADFPARALALRGEAIAVAAVLVAGVLSLARMRSAELARHPRITASMMGVTLRLSFGVPAYLFALVVSAAGFSA